MYVYRLHITLTLTYYRCQDYINVTDDGSGIIESCGTDPENNDMRLLDCEL